MEIEGTTVLVTGANRGIGRAIAVAIASGGAAVLAGVRAIDHDHLVPDLPNLRPVRIDLLSQRSVQESADAIATSAIDVLVNTPACLKEAC